MKVVVFFVASLSGGLVVGAAGRGILMDPPVVEEEEQQAAHDSELDSGIEIVQGLAGEGDVGPVDHTVEQNTQVAVKPPAESDPEPAGSGNAAQTPSGAGGSAVANGGGENQSAESPDAAVNDPNRGEEAGDDTPNEGDNDAIAVDNGAGQMTTQPVAVTPQNGRRPSAEAAPKDEAPARLALIFGSMDPKAAASVLIELSDAEIIDILGYITSARKTGEIIKNMPLERAGTLSRAMLATSGGG